MNEKKSFILTLLLSIVIVLFLGCFTYFINNIKFSSNNLFSGIPGRTYNSIIAKKFDYDSIILGSSMSQGFKCSEFNKAFNCESIKMTMSGANLAEITYLADFASTYKNYKLAMFDSSVAFFCKTPSLDQIPKEFYSDNVALFLLKKSFSINNFFEAIDFSKDLLRGKVKYTNRDDLYDWNLKKKCSEKIFAKDLLYKTEFKYVYNTNSSINISNNINKVLIPFFEKHPNKKFILFFPPYSIMWYRNVKTDFYIKQKRKIINKLLNVKNIQVYDFETVFHVMENFNNYKDVMHYSGKINSWIIQQIAIGNYRLTKENKEQQLKLLYNKLSTYDYNKTYEYMKQKYSSELKKKKK